MGSVCLGKEKKCNALNFCVLLQSDLDTHVYDNILTNNLSNKICDSQEIQNTYLPHVYTSQVLMTSGPGITMPP